LSRAHTRVIIYIIERRLKVFSLIIFISMYKRDDPSWIISYRDDDDLSKRSSIARGRSFCRSLTSFALSLTPSPICIMIVRNETERKTPLTCTNTPCHGSTYVVTLPMSDLPSDTIRGKVKSR